MRNIRTELSAISYYSNSNIQNYSKCFISVLFPCYLTHDHCLLIHTAPSYSKKWVYNQENPFLLGKLPYLHFNNHRRKNIHVCPSLPLNLRVHLWKVWANLQICSSKETLWLLRSTTVKENAQLSAIPIIHKWPKECRMNPAWQKLCSKEARWCFLKWVKTQSQEHNLLTW